MNDAMEAAEPAHRRSLLEFVGFGVFAGYWVALCIYFSNRRMMWPDEFDGWNLLTDPSWHHMIQSLNRGADGGSLLFYTIGRLILSVTGYHVLAMRMFSALCLWGAAVLWWRVLRKSFSDFPALLAVLLIWLCNPLFVYQLAEARFYGLLVLSTTIAISATVWVEERQPPRAVIFLVCFLANSLLVSSHTLGVIYSAVLVTALVFSRLPIPKRLAAIGGTVSSWLFFLMYLKAIRVGGQNFNWIQMPTVVNTLRYYFHTPTAERLFNAALFIFIVGCFVFYFRQSELLKQRSRAMLLLISTLLLLLPVGFHVVSHLYKPLFVDRYLMPYSLGFSCMFACALWLVGRQEALQKHRGFRVALQAGLLCTVGALHFVCIKQQPVRPFRDLEPLIALNHSLPLVIPYDAVFYQMRYYGGPSGANTFFPIPSSQSGYLAVVAQQGYAPGVVGDAEFLEQYRQFLYLDIPAYRDFYQRALAGDPQWVAQDVGIVPLEGLPVHLLRIEHR